MICGRVAMYKSGVEHCLLSMSHKIFCFLLYERSRVDVKVCEALQIQTKTTQVNILPTFLENFLGSSNNFIAQKHAK